MRATEYSRDRWRGAQQMRRRAEEFLSNDHDEVDAYPYQHVVTVARRDVNRSTFIQQVLHEIHQPTESNTFNSFRVCRACHKLFDSVEAVSDHVVDVHNRGEDEMLPKYVEPLRGIEIGDVVVVNRDDEDEQAYLCVSDGSDMALFEVDFEWENADDGTGVGAPTDDNEDDDDNDDNNE